ncbi:MULTISPECIES: serine-threonine protein kinase [Streptomyces]|uniref:Serine-threonine protein kinase n=1 Tax=Streptomyces dengpaensis TaxID=2049881 RepID=A0ABM6SY51_9ACTN|nr:MULTISPECIES: serine-threonine protein kinase [Streptomyces]AVH59623.1 serine-threonine protein kinase [Streptomyces dengpaensis]PIB06890.1 serine-threonine protein kinase [Streptomyces sp. HG99]
MADPEVSVSPYWELTFDAEGDVDGRQRDRLLKEVAQRKVRDLVVFAHGWNNDRSVATRLYSRFFEPFPGLAPSARLGYVGVVWPSMRFSDEPIPDLPASVAADVSGGGAGQPVLDENTRHALLEVFPGRATVVEQIARLLEQQPDEGASLEEFGRLVRLLVEIRPQGPQASFAADTLAEGVPESDPEMLFGDMATVCGEFAQALAEAGTPGAAADQEVPHTSFALPRLWDGAQELLRQATYYAMKRRAGTVGERGLGRAIGQLAKAAPDVRVHLVGHSFGGRLVSFALRGLPEGVRSVKSVTLLQGAFSHYAFAARLPHDPRASGVLDGQQNRIDGPLVCCYSHFDSALGTIYPLASRIAGDSRTATADFGIGRALGAKWGAMGHDGVQAVAGTKRFTLADALRTRLPTSGCVNIDSAAVVKRGGPPSGAHSDICHHELAEVVLAAGRVR